MGSHPRSGVYGLRLLSTPRVQLAALLTVLAILLLVRAGEFLAYSGQIQWGYDFSAYWRAGERVLAGEPVYAAFQVAGTYSPQQQYLYVYPPFLAVALAPFTAIGGDYRAVNWAWAAIGATLVVLVVAVVGRREPVASGRRLALLAGFAIAFAPVTGELIIGNVHLLILALLAGAWLGIRRGSRRGDLLAGALVGVAALIKVFPALLLVWFVVTGRTRAAAAALVTMLALFVATLPFIGLGPWLDYPVVLLNLGPPGDLTDVLAPTVWLGAVLPETLARIVVTTAGLVAAWWVASRRSEPVGFAVTAALSILIAPALYQHYLAVLVLPLLLAIRHAPPLAWVVVAYLLMSGGEQPALGDAVWIVNRVLPTAGALLVVAGLAWFGRDVAPATKSEPGASISV
jgi:alpha-1,2-mannosyltransferase